MELTAASVAAQLKAAMIEGPHRFRSVLVGLYAEEVEYRHEPPLPSDGIVPGARLAEANGREADGIGRVILDSHYENIEVVVDGESVSIEAFLTGSVAGGTAVRLPTRMRCRVQGAIVAVTHAMDHDAMRAWAEVAVAAGVLGSIEQVVPPASSPAPKRT